MGVVSAISEAKLSSSHTFAREGEMATSGLNSVIPFTLVSR